MPIRIFNKQCKVKLNIRKIHPYLSKIKKKLRLLNLSQPADYNIVFVDDKGIKKLNKKYRKTGCPTDVLSFIPPSSKYLGKRLTSFDNKIVDIFISVETAKNNAVIYKQKFYVEILRLIIHGILHSYGFTDYVKINKEKMWSRQEQILKCIL
ncbi:MAG: rRNA maturation RNase YbeY [Elusimicrobia bacterium]|nr:rRNA maturation RNase YbeY [Elusimicrobiota bacterium]